MPQRTRQSTGFLCSISSIPFSIFNCSFGKKPFTIRTKPHTNKIIPIVFFKTKILRKVSLDLSCLARTTLKSFQKTIQFYWDHCLSSVLL